MEDFWQLHFAVAGGKEHNSSDTLIANVDEICEGKWIKLTVKPDGSYTVENTRNKIFQEATRRPRNAYCFFGGAFWVRASLWSSRPCSGAGISVTSNLMSDSAEYLR